MIRNLENLIRHGELLAARRLLLKVKPKDVKREKAAPLANLARRVGLHRLALQIMSPIVRSNENSKGQQATIAERIEYAASLRPMGMVAEAAEILEKIDPNSDPQINFHRALCHFSEWRYDLAIPHLQTYVASFQKADYRYYVGQINLLEALIHEQLPDAGQLADRLLTELKGSSYSLHYQRCLVLAAQEALSLRHDFDAALAFLLEAKQSSGEQESIHSLLILKWLAICHSLMKENVLPEMHDVRSRAIAAGHWETVRECDFYSAKISSDSRLLTRLYFGTPYASYRQRILRALGPGAVIPESFLWDTAKPISANSVLDLVLAQTADGSCTLEPGRASHRFLILLTRDFYKPIPLLSVFSHLFPNEYFNPATSPNRVHHITTRFRHWLKREKAPLQLEEIFGNYRLRFAPHSQFAISIPRTPLPLNKSELEYLRVRALVKVECFSAQEAIAKSGMSRSSLLLILKWAVDNGKLVYSGGTHGARYKVA